MICDYNKHFTNFRFEYTNKLTIIDLQQIWSGLLPARHVRTQRPWTSSQPPTSRVGLLYAASSTLHSRCIACNESPAKTHAHASLNHEYTQNDGKDKMRMLHQTIKMFLTYKKVAASQPRTISLEKRDSSFHVGVE